MTKQPYNAIRLIVSKDGDKGIQLVATNNEDQDVLAKRLNDKGWLEQEKELRELAYVNFYPEHIDVLLDVIERIGRDGGMHLRKPSK